MLGRFGTFGRGAGCGVFGGFWLFLLMMVVLQCRCDLWKAGARDYLHAPGTRQAQLVGAWQA